MEVAEIVASIEGSGLAEWMRNSLKALPVINALHVMALAIVFGTVLIVDLRLLGFANVSRAVTRVHNDLIRWTWWGFVLATVTGVLMFIVNANTYYNNTAFRLKLLAMVAAGVNMLVFELVTARSMSQWDKNATPPTAARVAGMLSIVIWLGVIFLGRWIGFTKGYDFAIPEDVELDFDFLQ